MAENEGASKTEEATPRKLDDARKKGDVAKSQDVAPFAALAATVAVLATLGGPLCANLANALAGYVAHAGTYELSGGAAVGILADALLAGAPLIATVMLVALAIGVGIGLLQALTQIQEQTLVYAPKILAIFVTLLLFLPLMGALMGGFMQSIAARIAAM